MGTIGSVFREELSFQENIERLNEFFLSLLQEENINILMEEIEEIENFKELRGSSLYWKIEVYIDSFLFNITNSKQALRRLLHLLQSNPEINASEYYYLYWQINAKLFNTPQLRAEVEIILHRAYENIYGAYKSYFNENVWIPHQERDSELVIVFTNQFLSGKHAPTKIVLDHCRMLIDNFGKNVLLINTADLPRTSVIPYFGEILFNYVSEYNKLNIYNNFNFYQFRETMPSINDMNAVFKLINEAKPEFAISIGGTNITADLCSNFIPVISIPCTTDIPVTQSTFPVILRQTNEADKPLLDYFISKGKNAIESEVSYSINSTGNRLSRQDWDLNDTDFVISIVGNRLKEDLADVFLNSLESVVTRNPLVKLLIVGTVDQIQFYEYETLRSNTRFMGFQNDLSAVYSLCDIYLNPPRAGGGTSAAYALYEGVPVLTLPFGDVAQVVDQFGYINNLNELETYIEKWIEDENFRNEEITKSRNRASQIFDPVGVFEKVMVKARKNPLFY